MQQTFRHGLALLASGQAQKEITHNEALLAIDQQLHPGVESRSLTQPPTQPAVGAQFIVAMGATGDWAGRDGGLAFYDGSGWRFAPPVVGTIALVADEARFVVFGIAGWQAYWPVAGLRIDGRDVLAAPPATLGAAIGGSVIDTEARVVLATLLDALREQGIIM